MSKLNLLKSSARQRAVYAGIAISAQLATLVQLRAGKSQFELLNASVIKLSPGVIREGLVENSKLLGESLQQLKAKHQSSANGSIISIPSKLVLTKSIRTPKQLTESQLSKRVLSESQNLFPGLDKDLYLDYAQEEVHDQDGKVFHQIVMVGAKKQDITSYTSAFSHTGMPVKVVDVDRYALARAFSLILPQLESGEPEQYIALINIDSASILITVTKKKELVYSHQQFFNGSIFESHVEAKLGFNSEAASSVSDEALRPLSVQVERLLQFFSSELPGQKITKILLSGPLSMINNLSSFIEKTTQVKTILANPFLNLSLADSLDQASLTAIAPLFMLSAGLALRTVKHD